MEATTILIGVSFFAFLFLFDKVFPNFGNGMSEGIRLVVTLVICTAFAAVAGLLFR